VVPGPFPAAPLVVRRRYFNVVLRLMPAAPCRYVAVVPRPLPEAPLVVRRRYLVVVWCPGGCPRRRDAAAAGDEQLGRFMAKLSMSAQRGLGDCD
jgi:hypothetical protein